LIASAQERGKLIKTDGGILINQGEAAHKLFEKASTGGEIILMGGSTKAKAIISD
jgi:hypothetical protein